MDYTNLKENIVKAFPAIEFRETKQFPEVEVLPEQIHSVAAAFRNTKGLEFDYLYCLTGVDLPDRFMVVYHLKSTSLSHQLVLKVKTPNRENPALDTVSDVWPTAEFHEREVYDLLGVTFNNHKDLRRLFLEEGWGYPLRKDYKDDINFIER